MKPELNINKIRQQAQAGPISGDMHQHLQALAEHMLHLPDAQSAPARRSLMALFECLERVKALENTPLLPWPLWLNQAQRQRKHG